MVASKSRMFRTASGKLITTFDAEKAGVSTIASELTSEDRAKLLEAASERLGYKISENSVRLDGVGVKPEPKNNITPSPRSDKALVAKIEQERAKSGNVRFTPSEKEYLKREFERQSNQQVAPVFSKKVNSALQSFVRNRGGEEKQEGDIIPLSFKRSKAGTDRLDALVKEGFVKKQPFYESRSSDKKPDQDKVNKFLQSGDIKDFKESVKLGGEPVYVWKQRFEGYAWTQKGANEINRRENLDRRTVDENKFTITHPTFGTKFTVNREGLNRILAAQTGKIKTEEKAGSNARKSRKTADIKGLQEIKDENLVQMALF